MPFAMTHLYIAFNILSNTPEIKKPGDFMLGAIAPDSVHFRDNYNSDMKKISHLCMGGEKWGKISNNEEWLNNVFSFLYKNKGMGNIDFLYGYCSHILADIQNNIKIWTPFQLKNKVALEKDIRSIYHQESYDMDYVLYLLNPHQKVIWELLEDATGYDITNVVVGDEIDKMKEDVLHNLFSNRKSVDVSWNEYVTLSNMQEFISVESQYIKNLLYQDE